MNKAKCKNCGDIIESKNRHDMVFCTCYGESLRAINQYKQDNENASHAELVGFSQANFRGFFLDGGSDYIRCGGNWEDMEWLDD